MTTQTEHNPTGTKGFGFIEFVGDKSDCLAALFRKMDFHEYMNHPLEGIRVFKQGQTIFLLNTLSNTYGYQFHQKHGPSIASYSFHVQDYDVAEKHLVAKGLAVIENKEYPFPCYTGIGGAHLYLINDDDLNHYFGIEAQNDQLPTLLNMIDHITHNVKRGEIETWLSFYKTFFNFQVMGDHSIFGQHTGFRCVPLISPCGNIRIPINESLDDKSQIEEFIQQYNGEGIQHIAFATRDIFEAVNTLKQNKIEFAQTPASYYQGLKHRFDHFEEDITKLQEHQLLIDGEKHHYKTNQLLQIFTKTIVGPVFFELIQRKGNQGFGEGNIKALFEAMENDQIARGVISA